MLRLMTPTGSCLMRRNAAAILTIRGLLLVGDFSTTILTGGYILRKCSKSSYGADLEVNLMALGTGLVFFRWGLFLGRPGGRRVWSR